MELKELLAEAQKATAEAKKAAEEVQKHAAKAPAPKAKNGSEPPKVEDKYGYTAELVGYKAIQEAAQTIGSQISGLRLEGDPVKILIVGERLFSPGDLPLLQLKKQFAMFKAAFTSLRQKRDEILEQYDSGGAEEIYEEELETQEMLPGLEMLPIAAIAPIISAAPAIISAATELASFFKVSHTISGQDFKLGSDALTMSIAGSIQKHQVQIFHFHALNESELLNDLGELINEKYELEADKVYLDQVVAVRLDEQRNNLADSFARQEMESQINEVNRVVVDMESLSKSFGEFTKTISEPPNGDSQSLFEQAALRQHIRTQGITHLLFLTLLSSGGEAIGKQGFRASGSVYVGGGVFAYMLATIDGQIKAADTAVALSQLEYDLSSPEKSRLRKISFKPASK